MIFALFFLFIRSVIDLFDAKILDSTSMAAYCMDNNVVDILSLRRRENSASNASA
jgi:hypothetical protein